MKFVYGKAEYLSIINNEQLLLAVEKIFLATEKILNLFVEFSSEMNYKWK